MSRIFVQTYEANSLTGLQEQVLSSLARAQDSYAIEDLHISHAHHSYVGHDGHERQHCFSALVVLRVP
jgi:hypothetical protein